MTYTTTLPAKLDPSHVVAIVDSREKSPLDLEPLRTVAGTLSTGDYTVQGAEHVIRIELKGLGDLLLCCGRDRERFEREHHDCDFIDDVLGNVPLPTTRPKSLPLTHAREDISDATVENYRTTTGLRNPTTAKT